MAPARAAVVTRWAAVPARLLDQVASPAPVCVCRLRAGPQGRTHRDDTGLWANAGQGPVGRTRRARTATELACRPARARGRSLRWNAREEASHGQGRVLGHQASPPQPSPLIVAAHVLR